MDKPVTKRDLYFIYFLLFAVITNVLWLSILSFLLAILIKFENITE